MKSLPIRGSHHFLICLAINYFVCFVVFGPVGLTEALKAVSITRHYQGDLYQFKEPNPSPQSLTCECGTGSFQVGPSKDCQCQCFKDKPTLRDDTLECVNEFPECVLAEFVSSTQAEKIPYVYIPSNGQLLHPTAEIALLGLNHGESQLVSPICIVTNGQFLNQNGWQDLRNSTTFEAPFRLQPDSGKTYLQWTGDNAEKVASRGRVILVQLLCRDAASTRRTLFHPCVAFRVAGSPDAEELFTTIPEDTQGKNSNDKVLSTGEALAIGLVLGGLIIAYILVSLAYWRIKHNNGDILKFANGTKHMEEGIAAPTNKSTLTRNTVTVEPSGISKKSKTLPKTSLVSSEDDSDCDDLEDLSKKSKLSTKPFKNKENGSTTTADVHDDEEDDIYSIPSELEEKEGRRLRLERLKLEMESQKSSGDENDMKYEISPSVFGFSVAETIGTTASGARSLGVVDPSDSYDGDQVDCDQNDTVNKKKLYFNPSYFEPENLQSPPPAAVEFLSKIRDMISVAKNRMQTKAFQPSLIDIPEDDYGSQASRAPSTSSNARGSSQQTYTVDELEECEEEPGSDPIYSVALDVTNNNILEELSTIDDNRPNTLKRLAQRVNTHGQTLVSEIVQTLDLKPRLPDAYYNPYPVTVPSEPAPPRPNQKPVNSSGDGPRKCETVFPELVKPSMLRNAMNKDAKTSLESTNKFENFRQEMRATLSKVKAISPASSLSRNKSMTSLSNDYTGPKPSEQGESKVQKWLQSLDGKNNPYSKICEVETRQNIPSENENKHRLPTRTVSFCHTRQPSLSMANENSPFALISKEGQSPTLKSVPSVFRSHSLVKDPVKSESSFQRRQRTPMLDENKNYATSDSNDSLNCFVNNAMSKVPKICSSDSESVISDTHSRYKDSLEYNNMIINQKPRYPDSSKDMDRSCDSTSPLSILQETNVNTNGTGMYGNPFHSDPEISQEIFQENSYEEIHFGTVSKSKIPEALKLNDARVKKHIKEIRVGIEEAEDSLISEIHISGENTIGIHSSDNRLSIELTDDTLSSDSDNREPTNSNEKKKKKTRKVKRNDSILQDSLERPKTKKKSISAETPASLEVDEPKNKDTPLLKEEDEVPFTDSNSTKDDPTKVKCSKTLRTFKDYQAMKFTFKSGNNSKLSVVGEGIHFTYRTPSPSESSLSSLSAIHKPPLPPKQLKFSEDNQPSLDSSINSFDDSAPSIPPKHKLRYSASLSSDLQLKSIRTLSSIADIAPKLPPKIKHRNSFSDTSSHITVPPDNDNDPPKLPEKSRRRSNSVLSHSSSKGSIPELTEEEANSILNGVLAHSPSLDSSSISESIYSQGQNFLENGNIVNDSDYTFVDNVPDNLCEQLLDSEDEFESGKENVEKMSTDSSTEDYTLPAVGEEVIRGQFILSNSRPPTLHRQNSSVRESSRVMAQLQEMTASLEPLEKGLDGSLALKIKAELEQHFIEKSGADSIKRTWRKVLEKVDSNEKLTLKDLQKYILSLRSNQSKNKNEDSGYHSSTDSSDYSRIRKSKLIEPFKSNLKKSGTITIPSGLKRKTSNFFQRSSSLQQLIPGSLEINLINKELFTFNRNKLTSSMERSKGDNPRISVYKNNSFSIEAN